MRPAANNFVKRVHLLGGRRTDALGLRRDGRADWKNRKLEKSKEQEPKSIEDFENTLDNSARASPNLMILASNQGRANQTRFRACVVASGFTFGETQALVDAQSFEQSR